MGFLEWFGTLTNRDKNDWSEELCKTLYADLSNIGEHSSDN